MKKLAALILCMVMLCGCNASDSQMDGAIELRRKVSAAESCQFDCTVTADYSDTLYTFSMRCEYSRDDKLNFTVLSPESIQGICGSFDREGGKLTFDGKALAFPMLADGQLSPVSAPWLFIKTLCGGYIRASGLDGDKIRMTIDDSYEEDPLQADIWTDQAYTPVYCEFLWQGRRILSMEVGNFSCL